MSRYLPPQVHKQVIKEPLNAGNRAIKGLAFQWEVGLINGRSMGGGVNQWEVNGRWG